jgi:ABC-2 type transport system permease protein
VFRVMRAAAILQLQYLAVNLFMLFCVVVQPFFIAVTVMFMLRGSSVFDPLFVVVGSALAGLWSLVLFDGNWMIGRERTHGTLELVVGSPTPFIVIIAGKLAGTVIFSMLSSVVSYVVGAWLFGYTLVVSDPVGFAVSALLAMTALWATALLIAPLGILWRSASSLLNILEYPIYALGGFLFPIALLPSWAHWGSYLLPPFWAALALRVTGSGLADYETLGAIWVMALLSATVAVLAAHRLFNLLIHRAHVAGVLALS